MSIREVIAMLESIIKELIEIFSAYFEQKDAEGDTEVTE
jgi:hypothetical protein